MPDTHDTAATGPLLGIPDALTSEAAAMLLSGNVGGLKAVQDKLAAALAGQGLSGSAAGTLADGWVRSFAGGVGGASPPDAAIAEANRITAGTAERMAQALQESATLTGEQRLAGALAQGQGIERMASGSHGSADMSKALFDGVMDQLARPAGSVDPMAALSRALNEPTAGAPVTETVELSPAAKLTAALASGVAVQDSLKALDPAGSPDGGGLFATALERALSTGGDATGAVATATEQAARGGTQSQAVAVEQSGGDRLLTALAAGEAGALRNAGDGAAFASVLNDALARGTAPDAALGASAKAQATMAEQQNAASVTPAAADTLVAALASGRDVATTVKSFAVAAGVDPASAGGFGQALGAALSSGRKAAEALDTAHQDMSAATAMAAAAAQGVKGDGLVAALASGQNVQQAVQALGGAGAAFGAALGQALAEGRSPGQALAAAHQAADTVQQNGQHSEVPVSPENRALAELATPSGAEASGTSKGNAGNAAGAKEAKAETGDANGAADSKDGANAKEQVADSGEKDGGKDAAKEDAKDGPKDGGEIGDKPASDAAAPSDASSANTASPSPVSGGKQADLTGTALKSIGFGPPETVSKSSATGSDAGQGAASSDTKPATTAPIAPMTKTDPFAATALAQQKVVQTVTRAVESTTTDDGTTSTTTPTVTPVVTPTITAPPPQALAPTLASDFDAAAFAKALAVAEGTAAPAGFTVFHLIEAMFRPGTGDSSLIGVAVVANAGSALGVWQYSVDGTTWLEIGTVGDMAALVLPGAALLRFLPAAGASGIAPALGVRGVNGSWTDGFSGAGHTLFTLSGTGGTSPLSAEMGQLSIEVTAVNGAPVATGSQVTLDAIAEDTQSPSGATVSSLFGALFTDPTDAVNGLPGDGFAGIVVVGNSASASQGEWQYWNGSAWTAVGSVATGNALLLAADAKLRFQPAADWNGVTPVLAVRLVDTSEGAIVSGDRVNLSEGVGGTTRYSTGIVALTETVDAVNDAPVATGSLTRLTTVAEDAADPAGDGVTALFGRMFSDAADAVSGGSAANGLAGAAIVGNAVSGGSAANGLAGAAIVGNAASASQGVWQYWTGTAWTAVGTVSEDSALVVASTDKLRFVPAADWNGTVPTLSVRLIEQHAVPVVTGSRLDLTTGVGGSTAYSADTIAVTGTVTAVNDAPHVTAATASLTTLKGVAVAVTGLAVSDVDAGSVPLLVTLTAGHGTLTLADGGPDAVITGNGTGSVTVQATLVTVNSLLGAANGLLYTASSYTGADAISILVDDRGGGGSGGPMTASATVGVTVVPPNASPVLSDTDLQLSVTAEALAAPGAGTAGIAVSALVGLNGAGVGNVTDGDTDAVTGIALVGANESYGHWWYSTDGGAHWSLVGTVNDSDSALLLRATDRLYFQPDGSVPAAVSGALTIRAWDQTTGSHGTKAAVDTSAGSAFSTATDSVTLHPGVLIPNGSFDNGLTGWTSTGGTSVGSAGDGHEGTITSAAGKTPTELEDFLGLSHGSIATATGTVPSAGHAMKLAGTVTVTQDTTLSFDWSFTFSDPGYHDFGFVSVNGVVTLLAKEASASGTFTVVIPANTTLSLGFGASDTTDNSVNPILTVDNIKLTTVASDPIVLDLTGEGLSLRPLDDGIRFDVTGDGVADRTGWIGSGNALLVRDGNHNGTIDDAHELVSEQFGSGFGSSLEALASLDDNHDGKLNEADKAFATLQVWRDVNADGVSQAGELRTLGESGIRAIATTATPSDASMGGNRILGTTSMTMADGSTHAAAGVAFDVKATAMAQVQSTPTAGGTDFAALLSSGLGLPADMAAVQEGTSVHGSEWYGAGHDQATQNPQHSQSDGTHTSAFP